MAAFERPFLWVLSLALEGRLIAFQIVEARFDLNIVPLQLKIAPQKEKARS